jgi:hypothetical protein
MPPAGWHVAHSTLAAAGVRLGLFNNHADPLPAQAARAYHFAQAATSRGSLRVSGSVIIAECRPSPALPDRLHLIS